MGLWKCSCLKILFSRDCCTCHGAERMSTCSRTIGKTLPDIYCQHTFQTAREPRQMAILDSMLPDNFDLLENLSYTATMYDLQDALVGELLPDCKGLHLKT